MTTQLGFIVWTEDDSIVFGRGKKGKFSDGLLVSLYHSVKDLLKENGKDISQLDFKITLEQNDKIVAEHSYKMDKMTTFWLVTNPSDSDENGSFTTAFLSVFSNSPAGVHDYTVKLFVDGELFNQGELSFSSDGTNANFKTLIPKFNNIAATREQANLQHQEEYAQELEQDEKKQQKEREFNVSIENIDSTHTKYIVVTNQSSMSETIHEILPSQTLNLNLFRGSNFEIKYFDQDSSKDNNKVISIVNQDNHEEKFTIF